MSDDRIFGYTWNTIQRAQRGGALADRVNTSAPVVLPEVSDTDRALLAEHGADGLMTIGFHGVLDRLTRAGLV